jgi:hypothetical protein
MSTNRCPKCDAELETGAVLCVHCGFDFRTARVLETMAEEPEFETQPPIARLYFGPGLFGLVDRAVYALVDDSRPPSGVRLVGLMQTATGFAVLVAWVAIIAAFGYVFIEMRGPVHAPNVVPAGFGWILFLTIFPAAWSTLRIVTGLFVVVTGVTFADFHAWHSHLPIWANLLLTPIIVVVVAPLVVMLLVGTIAVCGLLFRLATQ